MRRGTSGFWLNEKDDGSISIGYEDYGVSEFGGGDYEQTYNLDCENALRLKHALQVTYNGSLKEMIEAAFGKEFSDRKFWSLCRENNIKYSQSSWISSGDSYEELYEAFEQKRAQADQLLAKLAKQQHLSEKMEIKVEGTKEK
jgi:hypothetical protein